MKKVLIMATAMIFAVSSTMLAANQSPAGKTQQPQKTTMPAKSDVQKQAVKAETKTPPAEMKSTGAATTQQAAPKSQERPAVKKEEQKNAKSNPEATTHKGTKHHKADKVPHSSK